MDSVNVGFSSESFEFYGFRNVFKNHFENDPEESMIIRNVVARP